MVKLCQTVVRLDVPAVYLQGTLIVLPCRFVISEAVAAVAIEDIVFCGFAATLFNGGAWNHRCGYWGSEQTGKCKTRKEGSEVRHRGE